MGVNKEKPHVFILPEDDANRQIANGFLLELDYSMQRQVQVLPVAGGWTKLIEKIATDHIAGLEQYQHRYLVGLLDFDGRPERLAEIRSSLAASCSDRIYFLGVFSEPEELKGRRGSTYETIGRELATVCRDNTAKIWDDDLLRINASELDRLRVAVRHILFE